MKVEILVLYEMTQAHNDECHIISHYTVNFKKVESVVELKERLEGVTGEGKVGKIVKCVFCYHLTTGSHWDLFSSGC